MSFNKPFMDEDLKERNLVTILAVLEEADEPLTVNQIQRRLGEFHNTTLSLKEIEAHLRWGANQPNASNAPTMPVHVGRDTADVWSFKMKRVLTDAERKAAGDPPWLYNIHQ
jgi:hypothetical protein